MWGEPLLPGAGAEKPSGWAQFLREHRADGLALLLGPAISVPFAVCYAALVCQEPSMQPHFPEVLQQIMWSQFLGAVVSRFIGQFVTTTNVDPLVAILLGQMATRARAAFQGQPELFFPNMLVAMSLLSVLLGLVLWAVGKFRLAFILRFFPYTVIGGFLAGTGLLILLESLKLAAGVGLLDLAFNTALRWETMRDELISAWAQLGLACVYAVLVGVARRANVFGTPALLVLCVAASVLTKGMTDGTYPPPSWFLSFPNPVPWSAPFARLSEGLLSFHPGWCIDVELTLSFLTIMTVSWSINTLAIKKLVPLRKEIARCDEQAEVQSLGVTNICLGAFGGHASLQSFKIPMMMREVQAGDLWPWFNLCASLMLFVYSPRVIIQNVPRFLFAGTVVRLASDLIIEWLVEARERIAVNEWRIMALTSVAIAVNLSLGVLLGLFMTLLLFAVEYTGVTGVVKTGTLQQVRSTVERSTEEHALLARHGHGVRVLWFSGYLFFGSVMQAVDEVWRTVEDPSVLCVVLDFSLVPAMDASGVYAMMDLIEELKKAGKRVDVVLCGLVRRLDIALRHAAEHKGVKVFLIHDLDSTLEWCEQKLLDSLASRGLLPQTDLKPVVKVDSACCIAGLPIAGLDASDEHTAFKKIWESLLSNELRELDPGALSVKALQRIAEVRKHGTGDTVFCSGDIATEIIILVKGSLEVTQPRDFDRETGGIQLNLPRHHLNEEKGDVFVFEEERPRRVRRARRGAVFGAMEYAASCHAVGGAADGEPESGGGGPSATERARARLRCTGTAVGDLELFALPFAALRAVEVEDLRAALVLSRWLARLAADALLAAASEPRLGGGHSCGGPGPPEPPVGGLRRSLSK